MALLFGVSFIYSNVLPRYPLYLFLDPDLIGIISHYDKVMAAFIVFLKIGIIRNVSFISCDINFEFLSRLSFLKL